MEDYEAFKVEAEMVTSCHARPAGHPLLNYHQEQKEDGKEERKEPAQNSEEENKCEAAEAAPVKKQQDLAEGLLGSGR